MTDEPRSDADLNEMLNTEEVSATGDNASPMEEATVETQAPAEVADEATDADGQPNPPEANEEAPVQDADATTEDPAPVEAAEPYVTLYNFVQTHMDKITNARVAPLAGFARVPQGKYMMFCTSDEDNADLMLFDRPSTMWMDSTIQPDSISIENSGLIIKSPTARLYVGKNNITKVDLTGDNITGISTISRAKDADSIKVVNEAAERTDAEVDTIKLHVKRISPRLYNVVKDMTTREEIKEGITGFMQRIYDLNHLVKIEKELLYSLGL